MIIVVGIVLALVTLVLPAASTLWRDRRIADAQNTISGMLMTARARAIQGRQDDQPVFHFVDPVLGERKLLTGDESGLFFYVDDGGVQRVAAIVQTTPEYDPLLSATDNQRIRLAWANVFTVVGGRLFSLPTPMRSVPRYVVDDPSDPKFAGDPNAPKKTFSAAEIANNNVYAPPSPTLDQAQRHRNFFTLIYSSDGRLAVGREVLIRDEDKDWKTGDPPVGRQGDVTGLHVTAEVRTYYNLTSATPAPLSTPPVAADLLVTDEPGVALNFPSVDGLLVYDESLFAGAGDGPQKRKYLVESSYPFYVHRLTGAVIRGPAGEAVVQAP